MNRLVRTVLLIQEGILEQADAAADPELERLLETTVACAFLRHLQPACAGEGL
jgi:hypothetical protein